MGRMLRISIALAAILAITIPLAHVEFAANHREAPITALDHKADITDVFAFRSYEPGSTDRVTLIMDVDPFLEPANGPNWFPFDPDILYEIKIDNNNDAVEDIIFQFRFVTEQRLPNLFQVYAGVPGGATAPTNSPPPVAPGTLIVPPQITSFSSPGLGMRQSYAVTMIKAGFATPLNGGIPLYAVPANVGPRTMNYNALFNAGIYSLPSGIRTFAGTVDDPFWIDLGGAFDTLNTSKAPPVLSAAEDAANVNLAADTVSGYAVNSIAIEVPIAMLTRTGAIEPPSSTAATIGVWGTTSRPRTLVRRSPDPAVSSGTFHQIQRMGNPLINELLVGTGFKDRFSMDQPKNDSQFANFFLDPALARVVNALTSGAVAIATPPRLDLLPVVTYAPPIAAPGTPAGPVADLLRLNTGVAPTPLGSTSFSRLGLLGGDPAGFPNGRRLQDDVTDLALRLVVGGVLAAPFPGFDPNIGGRLGDGVNVNDVPYRSSFPYLANAPSGRNRRHVDPAESFCTPLFGGGAPCLTMLTGDGTTAVAQAQSPAQQRIEAQEKAIALDNTKADTYNQLALALARRARETSDVAYYKQADEAIDASLRLLPDNFEAQKMRVWVLLGRHEFGRARELAIALNKRSPDDLLTYGFLTDANAELGNYKEAEEACQWMLDIRPGNIPAFTRAAYLREIFGQVEGAVELMRAAFERTPPTEKEDRAWILTQMAHLALIANRLEDAEQLLNSALTLFPDYHYALANLAKVRTAQKRYKDAVALLQKRYDAAPHAENLYALAEALERAGQVKEAKLAYAEFETKARAEMKLADNANRELIFYYTDHARNPAEALRVAESEIARRQDVYTLDAYAWALHANKRSAEARQQIDRALAVGVRDPVVLDHAGVIRKITGA